ncbi:protein kinase domain-containing protein [Zavarzinella formosa]|uniref:protein kinase domain-containing protein n=1 Tax=Zavarzinella formosa TaxID=360055 RepID=UPI0003059A52|nr:protein kinase [Zavarzinella formosa]
MEETSAELLERFRQGDAQAADALFHRYVERLTFMVRRQISLSLRRRIDPEDAVHSAYRSFFIKAGRGEFVLEHSGDLWKLLVTMTLNKLRRQIAHHSAGKRAVHRDRPLESAAAGYVDGPSPLEALATADELESFMAKLAPEQRTILEMRLQDRTWAEIAEATGRPDRTVRRVIEEIRQVWGREIPSEGPEATAPPMMAKPASVPADSYSEGLLDYSDFMLNELVGRGGTGKVYRAWWKSKQQQVAVKTLHKSQWVSRESAGRFLEEARIIARLRHPGIVLLHGVGQIPGGGLFIVMDFIEGSNLAEIAASGRPSPRQAVEWVAEVAATLAHAHDRGIIHCDLKPGNLMREHTGRIVVGDFGLAMNLEPFENSRTWAGTPGYMAPEQLDSAFGQITPATDIFALGLVLARLLTGRVVFEGKHVLEVLLEKSPSVEWWRDRSDPDLPSELKAVISKCLTIDPASRLSTATRLADGLRAAIQMFPTNIDEQ